VQPIPLFLWGRAPCDECSNAQRCQARLEACIAFEVYLKGGAEKRWTDAPRVPQRAIYVSLLAVAS
jgi:hypothetical protein